MNNSNPCENEKPKLNLKNQTINHFEIKKTTALKKKKTFDNKKKQNSFYIKTNQTPLKKKANQTSTLFKKIYTLGKKHIEKNKKQKTIENKTLFKKTSL